MPKKKKTEKKEIKKPTVKVQLSGLPLHQVECLRCNAVTPIKKMGHNPTAIFVCIQCNAPLDIFNNCKTCNE